MRGWLAGNEGFLSKELKVDSTISALGPGEATRNLDRKSYTENLTRTVLMVQRK